MQRVYHVLDDDINETRILLWKKLNSVFDSQILAPLYVVLFHNIFIAKWVTVDYGLNIVSKTTERVMLLYYSYKVKRSSKLQITPVSVKSLLWLLFDF